MAIAINGSGTITGISVGGIPDGTVDTDVLAANAVTYAKLGTTEQGQLCKAWVNFNGTGTVAIRASYNVSSITDNGTGDYTVNFTTAFADANYSAVVSRNDWGALSAPVASNGYSQATDSYRLIIYRNDGSAGSYDSTIVGVAIFR
jgi:hypothetical protein